MIMKKLLRYLFVCCISLLISFSSHANPLQEGDLSIASIFFYNDSTFRIQFYINYFGDVGNCEMYTTSSMAYSLNYYIPFCDMMYFDNSNDPDFCLNRECDTIWIENGFSLSKEYIVIGSEPGADIPPIPIGVNIVNHNYQKFGDYFWIYDDKPNERFTEEFSKATAKFKPTNTEGDPLPGFVLKTDNQIKISENFSSQDGCYYGQFLSPVNNTTELVFFNGEENLFIDDINLYPGDTLVIEETYNIADSVSLTGYCQLQNESQHSGSGVFIEPYNQQIPYSIQTIQNNDGYYNIEIPSGIYRIGYFHDGYEAEVTGKFLAYVENQSENFELVENETVINIINPVFPGSFENAKYYCFSDMVIPGYISCIFEKGSSFIIPTNCEWLIDGSLVCNGSAESGISFTSLLEEENHTFMDIKSTSEGTAFEYCSFDNFDTLIVSENNTIIFNHNFVNNTSCAFYGIRSDLFYENGYVSGNVGKQNQFIGNTYSDFHFSNVNFFQSRPVILAGGSIAYVDSCSVDSCFTSYIKGSGTINTNYSVFINNDTIVYGDLVRSHCVIDHCTFTGNHYCFYFITEETGNNSNVVLDISHSISTENFWFIRNDHYNDLYMSPDGYVDNCLFNDAVGAAGYYFNNLGYLGEIDTVNLNNNPCDQFQNLYMDPLLKDDLHLNWNSPCINAGDPNASKDPDSTITDMGAYFYDLTTLIQEAKKDQSLSARSYPNPATEQVTFDISHENGISGTAVITLYNLEGVSVATAYEPLPPTESLTRITMPLKNRGLTTGLYVYTIKMPGRKAVGGKLSIVH